MSSTEVIRTDLLAFLANNDLLDGTGEVVAPDSMAMVLISMEIDTRWAPFPQDCLEIEHFVSVDSIVKLIEELVRRSPRASS